MTPVRLEISKQFEPVCSKILTTGKIRDYLLRGTDWLTASRVSIFPGRISPVHLSTLRRAALTLPRRKFDPSIRSTSLIDTSGSFMA